MGDRPGAPRVLLGRSLLSGPAGPQPAAATVRPNGVKPMRCGVAAVTVALAAAAAGCSASPRCPPGASCPPIVPRVVFTPAINGILAAPGKNGHIRSYQVRSGERVVVRLAVTVPAHLRLSALWFGISDGTWGSGPGGRPTGMRPILAHYSAPLPAGTHAFMVRWRIPRRPSGASFYLTYAWTGSPPPASVSGAVAQLKLG